MTKEKRTVAELVALLTVEERTFVAPQFALGDTVYAVMPESTTILIPCPACPDKQGWFLGVDGEKYQCPSCRGHGARRVTGAGVEERVITELHYNRTYENVPWSYTLLRADEEIESDRYSTGRELRPLTDLAYARGEYNVPLDGDLMFRTRAEAEERLISYNEENKAYRVTWGLWEKKE